MENPQQSVPPEATHTNTPEVKDAVPQISDPTAHVLLEEPSVPLYKKHKLVIGASLLAVLILGGSVYYAKHAQVDPSDPAAVVATICPKNRIIFSFCYAHASKIRAAELNENIALMEAAAEQQGADINQLAMQEQIKKQALDILIDNALILDASTRAGHTASPEEVQEQYDELVTQMGGEAALKAELENTGVTDEKLRNNIRERVFANKYIEAETDIESVTVSEEDLARAYEIIKQGSEQAPKLEDIKPLLEAQLISQKQNEIIAALLEKVRGEMVITIK